MVFRKKVNRCPDAASRPVSQSKRSALHITCCSPERTSGCPTDCAAAWAEFVVPHYHDNASSHLHLHLRFIHIRRPDVARCCLESQTPHRSRGHLLIPANAKRPTIPHQSSVLLQSLTSAPDKDQWTISGRRHPLHSGVFSPCWHWNPGIKCLKLKGQK